MAARKGPNALALARAVKIWRDAGRLDPVAELQIALAAESARLVDMVADSDASAATRADCLAEHRHQVAALRAAIPPVRRPNPFDRIEEALAESLRVEKVEEPSWDAAEDALAADPTTWPEVNRPR